MRNLYRLTFAILATLIIVVVVWRLAIDGRKPWIDKEAVETLDRVLATASAAESLECEVNTELPGFVRIGPFYITDREKLTTIVNELQPLRVIAPNPYGAGDGGSPYTARLKFISMNHQDVTQIRIIAGHLVVFGDEEQYMGYLDKKTLFDLLSTEALSHAEGHPKDVFKNE